MTFFTYILRTKSYIERQSIVIPILFSENREHKQVCGFTEILPKVTVEQSSLDLLFMQRPDCGEPLVEDIPQKMKKFDRSQ